MRAENSRISWDIVRYECVAFLQRALEDFKWVKGIGTHCRHKCRRITTVWSDAAHPPTSEFSYMDRVLRKSLCLQRSAYSQPLLRSENTSECHNVKVGKMGASGAKMGSGGEGRDGEEKKTSGPTTEATASTSTPNSSNTDMETEMTALETVNTESGTSGKTAQTEMGTETTEVEVEEDDGRVPILSTYIERVDTYCIVIRGYFGGRGSQADRDLATNHCLSLEKAAATIDTIHCHAGPTELALNQRKHREMCGKGDKPFYRKTVYWISKVFDIFCCPPLPAPIINKIVFLPPTVSYNFTAPDGTRISKENVHRFSEPSLEFNVHYCLDPSESIYHPIDLTELRGFLVPRPGHKNRFIAATYLPTKEPGPFLFVYSHANAMDLGMIIPFLYKLRRKLGCPIVAYDYPGYGLSFGQHHEAAFYQSVEVVVDWTINTLCLAPANRIIAMGFSLGTVATIHVATRYPDLAAVVITGSFLSALNTLRRIPDDSEYSCRSHDKFCSYSRIGKIQCPLLVCHGLEDRLTKVQHGLWLLERTKRPLQPLFLPDTEHNDLDKPLIWCRLRELLHHDLGAEQPHAALRRRFAALLQDRERGRLHDECLDGPGLCKACHFRIINRFFDSTRLAILRLEPSFAIRARCVRWEVAPVGKGKVGSWEGRFSIILGSPLISAADLRLAIAANKRPLPLPPSVSAPIPI